VSQAREVGKPTVSLTSRSTVNQETQTELRQATDKAEEEDVKDQARDKSTIKR
jgi:hypothetical protein